jgi:hypothetical protein
MSEEWRPVEGYEDYEVSNLGNVRSLNYRKKKGNIQVLKSTSDKRGYQYVCLGRYNIKSVHCLVCQAFLGERPEGLQIDHKDINPSNNNISNLRYVTARQNQFNRNFKETRGLFRRNETVWEVRLDNKNWGSYRSEQEAIQRRDAVLDSLIAREAL